MTSQSWTLPAELRSLAEDGAEELVKEVLSIFQSDTAKRLALLRAAVEEGNRAVIQSQAHAIKGSAGQVGALGVAEICRSIESDGASAGMADLSGRLCRLESAFADVCRAMNE